ncbi:MAG TPA: glycosyltransferase [Cyclobacteriaceae bacterium]|nr:glycosyltransferase [Cyclobacteriaceae bacterium]
MNVILYESASHGGNFDYSRHLFSSYGKHLEIESLEWLIPSSSPVGSAPGVYKILCDDNRKFRISILNRFYFVYRSFANPLRLFRHLRSKKNSQLVILNDFEQLTAPFWVPFYKAFLKRHWFAVVLHDPDRDAYPPSKAISRMSMKGMMSLMSIALYHEHLPEKPYYVSNKKTTYISIPHGQYEQAHSDHPMTEMLRRGRKDSLFISIIGNIRMEKNYEMAIEAVSKIPGVKLVIAGSPSSSSVSVEKLRTLAASLQVEERVVFILKFLTQSELNAVVESSDVILLNYKNTFASQSGIFNLIAPYKKRLIISRTESGLAAMAKKFGIGHFVEPDDPGDFVRVLRQALQDDNNSSEGWNEYLQYSSWENHVNIVVSAFKRINTDAV